MKTGDLRALDGTETHDHRASGEREVFTTGSVPSATALSNHRPEKEMRRDEADNGAIPGLTSSPRTGSSESPCRPREHVEARDA